jgi:hypothetical protein
MINEHEHINLQFETKAREASTRLFNDFIQAVNAIDRKNDEYRFRQSKEQYVNTLKLHLQTIALEILHQHQANEQISGIDQHLNHLIKTELHQFVQKLHGL